ncbi:MAG TPA: hypothetical protein VGX94_01550 [Terriglobia bacterium]|nr:hypothetical protein [Terriglobia bacterium]
MKRFAIGTALWLGIVGAVVVIALRWPVVFWLVVLIACVYLVFGWRTSIDLRIGAGNGERERRLYAVVVWKRKGKSDSLDSEVDGMKLEDRVQGR